MYKSLTLIFNACFMLLKYASKILPLKFWCSLKCSFCRLFRPNSALFWLQFLIPILRRLNGRSQTVNLKQQQLAEADQSPDLDLQMESSSSTAVMTASEEPQRAKRARLDEPSSSNDSSQTTAFTAVKTIPSYEEQVLYLYRLLLFLFCKIQ